MKSTSLNLSSVCFVHGEGRAPLFDKDLHCSLKNSYKILAFSKKFGTNYRRDNLNLSTTEDAEFIIHFRSALLQNRYLRI